MNIRLQYRVKRRLSKMKFSLSFPVEAFGGNDAFTNDDAPDALLVALQAEGLIPPHEDETQTPPLPSP